MKPTKANQLRQMSIRELEHELQKQKEELYRLRVQKSRLQLKDTSSLKITRKNIARILTILHQKRAQTR